LKALFQPSAKIEYALDDLINGIDASNAHSEFSFGMPVGNEAL
jgi:hypothetical protein